MRKLAKLLMPAILLSTFAVNSFAQDTQGCPVVSISGPSEIVPKGRIARYSLDFDPIFNFWPLTYKWSTSAGPIGFGQGTPQVGVIQSNDCLTVTVEISGQPDHCPPSFSETSCIEWAPQPEKLVETFGTLNSKKIDLINRSLSNYNNQLNAQFFCI